MIDYELTVADWEYRLEAHRERIRREKKIKEKSQSRSMGFSKKMYKAATKSKSLEKWC